MVLYENLEFFKNASLISEKEKKIIEEKYLKYSFPIILKKDPLVSYLRKKYPEIKEGDIICFNRKNFLIKGFSKYYRKIV